MLRLRNVYMGPETGTAAGGASGAGRTGRTDLISMFTQLAPQLFGTGTSTSTTTSGKTLSAEQMQSLLNNMMASSSGLTSALMPQRQAGLYNSPVNTLLTQQLSANLAAKVAEAGTPTTTTQSSRVGASPGGKILGGALGALQAASMAKKGWDNKDTIAKVLNDPAGELKKALGITGGDFGPSIDLANPANLDAAGLMGPPSDLANYLNFSSAGNLATGVPTMGQGLTDLFSSFSSMDANPIETVNQVFSSSSPVSAALEIGGTENAGPFGSFSIASSASAAADTGAAVADVAGAGSQAADWVANAPGSEAADYLSSLGAEGADVGMELADVASSSAGIPYLTIAKLASKGMEELFGNNIFTNAFEGVMEPVNEIFGSVIGGIEDIGGGILDAGESILSGVGDVFEDIGGGCFLTTACMVALADDFKDDCRELEAMRTLRDGYAQTLDEGPRLIQQYYKEAPSYVMWINARDDATAVWTHLYHTYILPAVVAVEKQHMHRAYEIYVQMVGYVKDKATEEGV